MLTISSKNFYYLALCTYALTSSPSFKVVWNSVIDTKLIKESKGWFSGSKSESLKRGYVARINPDEGKTSCFIQVQVLIKKSNKVGKLSAVAVQSANAVICIFPFLSILELRLTSPQNIIGGNYWYFSITGLRF